MDDDDDDDALVVLSKSRSERSGETDVARLKRVKALCRPFCYVTDDSLNIDTEYEFWAFVRWALTMANAS